MIKRDCKIKHRTPLYRSLKTLFKKDLNHLYDYTMDCAKCMDSSYGSPNAKYISPSNFGMQIVDQIKTLEEHLRVCG